MTRSIALLTVLAASVPVAAQPAQPSSAAPEPTDIIVPLNVRDPSALVMGPAPGQAPSTLVLAAPERAAPASAKAAKSSFAKAGPAAGRRSVGLAVPEDQLLTVKPGDRVDVVAVFDRVAPSGAREKTAATLLQNVKVLGVTTTGDLHGSGVLTLELNPIEVQYALLGVRQADLGVAVRAAGDEEKYPMEMSTFFRLYR